MNIEDGFDVQSGATNVTLKGNTALDNNGVGIEVSRSATDTTVNNNDAHGNGIDFCDEGTNTMSAFNYFGTTGPCVVNN